MPYGKTEQKFSGFQNCNHNHPTTKHIMMNKQVQSRQQEGRHSPSVPLGVMELLFIWELSSLGPLGDSLLPLRRLCGLVRSCISIDLKTRSLPFERCTKFITPLFNVLMTWHLFGNTFTPKVPLYLFSETQNSSSYILTVVTLSWHVVNSKMELAPSIQQNIHMEFYVF